MKDNPFENYTEKYDQWFEENPIIYQSALLALKQFAPLDKKGIEIGIGSGRFAIPLNIRIGIEPSENMASYCKK